MYEIYGPSILRGGISINYFLLKRAARIIPLTYFTIFLTVIFSFLTQNNELAKSIYKDGLFAILGVANFHFWQQTDYFSLPVESVPLLHLWSLSLEMQFYIFFAFHLFMLNKYKKADYFFKSCQVIAALSFLIYLATAKFASANYYLLPARIWQFYTGIIIAWFLSNKINHIPKPFKSNFASKYLIISLVLLTSLINISVFSLQIIFMLLFAFIFFIGKLTEKNNLGLFDKLFAKIGRASFTLYILHLPLIFVFQTFLGPIDFWTITIYLFYFLVLAPTTYMTYKLIEGRLYRKLLSKTRRYVLIHITFGTFFCLIIIAVLNTISFASVKNKELFEQITLARKSEIVKSNECQFNIQDLDAHLGITNLSGYLQSCVSARQKFLVVIGDSHATDLFNSIVVNFPGRAVIDFSVPGCRVNSPECRSQYSKAVLFVNENKQYIQSIFYHSKGSYFFIDHDKYPLDQVLINGTINYLKKLPEVIWIGPQAEPRINLLKINRQNSFPKKWHSLQQNLQIKLLDKELRKKSSSMGITYYSLEENIKYNFYEDFLHNGKFTYSDEDHWSAYGEEYFGQKFLKDLIQLSD
jgi:peptidoglycan/LPS O-acetylase OafA/YrhL